MAQIVLSEVGAAVGSRLLPEGLSVLGQQIAGQAIGRAAGAVAGRRVDAALFSQDVSGPRLKSLHVMESREGAGIANVYGRMRVGGQVIWAARFRETRRESGGGKGGPSVTEYAYSVSFAVGICEGPVTRVDRVWANGEPLDLSSVNARIYPGDEHQVADPIIEAVEGSDSAPAYRGLCYIVFEDLPLAAFGNRIPQLSFEVVRVPPGRDTLGEHVRGVNVIPASGEFAYSTDVIRTREFPGIERPQNANSGEDRADFLLSIEQLTEELPRVDAAALTVAWFGDDLRAGQCSVRPKVETQGKVTRPWAWEAGGLERVGAQVVSTDGEGRPYYGGTPADWSIIQAIQAQKAEGIAVTMSPFLLMDVPPGNGLPDPHGGLEQAVFPWRGRITSTADKTASARADVDAFLGEASVSDFSLDAQKVRFNGPADDWGYRRFVLHLAWLAKAAGGVDGFLLGSELRGLTRLRDEGGAFPFVEGLIALASDVRAILGPDTLITYAADWTEYGAYAPSDGSNDVVFPLDDFWAHPDVDLVAVDWYPPSGDWRPGDDHLDALAGYAGPDDPEYLHAQFAGGEGYDWYYASPADRAAQVRTPINDTAHGEHWVFRAKDIENWWRNAHHPRPGGQRSDDPTSWVPGSKPVRLAEIGFPAVDNGPNSPNLFYDPKSSESAFPSYSSGQRDDVLQRRALVEALGFFSAKPFIEQAFVWCWDARPYPAFPLRDDVWGDGENWHYGHWLNGRTGMAPLNDVVADLASRGGGTSLDTSALDGIVEGYALEGITTVRGAIEPLRAAYGFDMVETVSGLRALSRADEASAAALQVRDVTASGIRWQDTLLDASPGRLILTYADPRNGYQPATVEARLDDRDLREAASVALPIAFSSPEAERIASRLLETAQPARQGQLAVPFTSADLTVGAVVSVDGHSGAWQIGAISDGVDRTLSIEPVVARPTPQRALTPPARTVSNRVTAAPELLVIDGPRIPGINDATGPLLAASADPWPGEITVEAGPAQDAMAARAVLSRPAVMGVLTAPLAPGPVGRWDRAATLDITFSEAAISPESEQSVLAGENQLLVETATGWELLAFQVADFISGRTYRLTGLLRGLQGTEPIGAVAGARALLIDDAVMRAEVGRDAIGLTLNWRAAGGGETQAFIYQDQQNRPWPVTHLQVRDGALSWVRRHPLNSDSWVLADTAVTEAYLVTWVLSGGTRLEGTVYAPIVPIAPGAVSAEVSEIGPDGQIGVPRTISWA